MNAFPEFIADVKTSIVARQRVLDYHGKHVEASQLKYLLVASLGDCDDYDLLLWYDGHLERKERKQ